MNTQLELDLQPKKLVKGILSRCDIKTPPTDNQTVLDFFGLKLRNLSTFIRKPLSQIGTEIRAILDNPHKIVFIHDHLISQRYMKNFSVFHEIAHFVLPSHRKILHECSWRDLNSLARKRLEIQANSFAADCIFQLDRFNEEALDMPFSLKTPFELARKYGASFEATFRRYVETNLFPCALVVYKPESFDDDEPDALAVNYTVRSKSFKDFKYIIPHQKIGAGRIQHKIFFEQEPVSDFVTTDFKTQSTLTGEKRAYLSQCFSNKYKVFQLVFPADFRYVGK